MNIVIMWPNITQYIGACINEMVLRGHTILIIEDQSSNSSNKKYSFKKNATCEIITLDNISSDKKVLIKKIEGFNADIALISLSSWGYYNNIDKILSNHNTLVIGAVDAFNHFSKREALFAISFKLTRRKYYKALFVPGYRSFLYGKTLGFSDNQIFEGLYTCDTNLFSQIGQNRIYERNIWPNVFLFIGQYIERKGLDTLIKSYQDYRSTVDHPWELWCIGDGPLKSILGDQDGVKDFGFLTQNEIIPLIELSGALVIPSVEDHWPLVIHEAACAGLPIIASTNCGSTVELIMNGINGFIHEVSNHKHLVQGLKYVSTNDTARMGYESYLLSKNYSVVKWANILLDFIPYINENKDN